MMDLHNKAELNKIFHNADALVHCAAMHGYHLLSHSKQHVLHNNIVGDFNTLASAVEQGVRRIVLTSSTSIYGLSKDQKAKDAAVWVDETRAPDPEDVYDIGKVMAETLLSRLCAENSISGVALRVTRFFPGNELQYNLRKLNRGIDVRDAARAHAYAACNSLSLPSGLNVFNVSALSPFQKSDCPELLVDAPSVLRRYYPDINMVFQRYGWEMPRSIDRIFDISKIGSLLEFIPNHNFDEYYYSLLGSTNTQRV
jgi:UDP-glucose 4-epimerase